MSENRPHLLIVDDERSIREPLAAYLGRNGFRTTQASDARDARAKISAYAIDLVVLDIMLPGEDGLSLCRHLRANSDYDRRAVHTLRFIRRSRDLGFPIGEIGERWRCGRTGAGRAPTSRRWRSPGPPSSSERRASSTT